jgi:LDH2 family malate/lactate/ureidoglycolate dehydrogenase
MSPDAPGQDHAEWTVHPDLLSGFIARACAALGAPPPVAAEVAAHLVGANLAGHDSHGVIRLSKYVGEAEAGDLVPAALPEVVSQFGATALIDARRGFGHYSTRVACEWAASTAARLGVSCAVVRHSGHIGRLGHYVEALAGQGLVGIVTVGMAGPGVGAMVVPGTARRFFGANPWAFGVPVAGAPPIVVDISTAVIAEGKVQVALAEGKTVAEGCIVDAQGRPTTSPVEYFSGGGLLPLGGTVAGHKGFGLALAAALVGALAMISDPTPSMAGAPFPADGDRRGRAAGVFVVAVDPAAFGDREAYASLAAETVAAVRRAQEGLPHPLVPGDPEVASRARRAAGVPLPEATRQELAAIAERLGIDSSVVR